MIELALSNLALGPSLTAVVLLGGGFVAAQTQAPANDAGQTFYNVLTLIVGSLASILIPVIVKRLGTMNQELKEAKKQVETASNEAANASTAAATAKAEAPKPGVVESLQAEIGFLHERIDNLVDNLTTTRTERDDARTTLERSNQEFLKITNTIKADLEGERETTSSLIHSLEENQQQTDRLEGQLTGLLSMNQLADMIIDRMEISFEKKIVPLITEAVKGKGTQPDAQ